jgi:hypothetical protein
MTAGWVFLCGLALTIGISLLALFHIQAALLRILIDLCGTEDRAGFWLAFSNITLLAIPTIFALHHYPSASRPPDIVFEISDQLEGGLIGLVISVVILGIVLSHFILHAQPREKKEVLQDEVR